MSTIEQQSDIEIKINDFVGATATSRVAVIVPLFGFWADIPDNLLNGEVLDLVLRRVHSSAHLVTLFVVGDPKRQGKDVQNALAIAMAAGNVRGVKAESGSTYGGYVREGFKAALDEDNQFVIILNPWTLIQEGGIDMIVERANRGDEAKIICGYDFNKLLEPEAFDGFRPQTPIEERGLSFNFMAMPRYAAEMIQIDSNIQTHGYLERDLWQDMYSNSFEAIFSQRIPVFPFEIDWKAFETPEMVAADRSYFISKWKFDVDV